MTRKKDFVRREEFERHKEKNLNTLNLAIVAFFISIVMLAVFCVAVLTGNPMRGLEKFCIQNETISSTTTNDNYCFLPYASFCIEHQGGYEDAPCIKESNPCDIAPDRYEGRCGAILKYSGECPSYTTKVNKTVTTNKCLLYGWRDAE